MVAAIVAGDPEGIAEAYDTYALPLHSYCLSLLAEPADAADAVQDTFLIATAKLAGLLTRASSGPGCTRSRGTSATASSVPGRPRPRSTLRGI